MAIKAEFKTAYLQRMILVDATLAADVRVGDLVTFDPSTGAIAAATTADATVANGAIIAQSDASLHTFTSGMSAPYAHVKIEDKTWQFDGKVAASTTAKKVAIFRITNPLDVTVYTEAANANAAIPEQPEQMV